MKLTKLSLKNFKGIRNLDIEAPKGKSINIYGENGTGKTTVADSITWLLFGKDTEGRSESNFGIKTKDSDGNVIHELEHIVLAIFTEPDITLCRVYKEKWVRSRGESEATLDSHTTEYYVDDEPLSKKAYTEAINEIMDEELFQLLTIPTYFASQLHWSQRRKVLMDVAGKVDESKVSDELSEVLNGKTIDSRKSILENNRKAYLKQIDDIPARIEENRMAIESVDEPDKKELKRLQEQKAELQEKLSKVKSGGGVSDLQVKMEEIETEKQELRDKAYKELEKERAGQKKALEKLEEKVESARQKAWAAHEEMEDVIQEQKKLSRSVVSLKSDLEELKTAREGDECPYCGQDMPDQSKGDKAEKIKLAKDDLTQAEKELKTIEKELVKAEKEHKKLHAEYVKLNDQYESERAKRPEITVDLSDNKEYQSLVKKQEALEKKISDVRSNRADAIEEVEQQIVEVEGKIEYQQRLEHQAQVNADRKKRISKLQDELKEAKRSLEKCERDLFTIQKFEVARAKAVAKKVNAMFDTVTWKMHEVQMNGGINDQMCEPVVNGVPYNDSLNNAARIQAGLEIIHVLGKHHGKEAPVVIDNAEAITKMETYGLQVIALYVSAKHKELKVEVAK